LVFLFVELQRKVR